MTRALIMVFTLSILTGLAMAEDKPVQEKKKSEKADLSYLLYLPSDYAKSKEKFPLMLFLHGAGERGNNLDQVKRHGPPKLVEKEKKMPFVIVSPQCARGSRWDPKSLIKLVDEVIAAHRIDTTRVYVTGLSMGGYGSWALAAAYPDRFAAIAPICGGGDPRTAGKLKALPIWVFHGGKDRVVPLSRSKRMVDAIEKAGGKSVKLTVYPEAGHDSWTKSYNNPELYKWFLKHSRK